MKTPAAVAAARAAAQAAAVAHMGAHALGAAAYAAPDRPEAVSEEIRSQLDHMSAEARATLKSLPPIGEGSAGPLGPGLLTSGMLASIIRSIQADLADADQPVPPG